MTLISLNTPFFQLALEKYLKAYARINKTFISNSNRVVTQKSSLSPEKVASWDPTFSPSRTTSNRILSLYKSNGFWETNPFDSNPRDWLNIIIKMSNPIYTQGEFKGKYFTFYQLPNKLNLFALLSLFR
jgi:hypothetical protein